jgi:chromosome segregation ATPase
MSNDQEKPSNWGGSRPGAGNKYKWKSGETKAIRIPIAIADEVLKAAQAIDEGKSPLINDCVTQSSAEESNELTNRKAELEQVKAYNSKLSKEVSELETKLFKASQQLQQVTKERNEYFDRIADIQLELDNLKDDRVTQSNPRVGIEAKVVELEKSLTILSELHRESDLRCQELESLLDDCRTRKKYEAEESDRIQRPIIGIDLEEFYDAVILSHPPRERKLIGKPMTRFKTLIAEALTRRGVPVR